MTTAIIDGDIIAFKSAAAVSVKEDTIMQFDPARAKEYVDFMMNEWIKRIKPNVILMCFSDPSRQYFRHNIYPEYKANRGGMERPSALTFTYEYLAEKYRVVQKAGLEADDLLGILGTQPDIENPVVVSIDKDIMTLPCKVFNPDKMRRPIRINPNVADLAVFKQAMMGDSSDNYKGIPRIGTAKADKILADAPHPKLAWDVTRDAFISNGLTEADALLMVRLARILRHGDYKEATGEVRLWTPDKQDTWMKLSAQAITNSPDGSHSKTEQESEPASKLKSTSRQSAKHSMETKRGQSVTSSNTSADTEQSTETTSNETSTKPSSTATFSKKSSRRKKQNDA
mgnify:FL=1